MPRSLLHPRVRITPILACAFALTMAASARADPKPLSKEEQAKVNKAVEKAVAYLKHKQTKEGNWPTHWKNRYLVGECALPAYALLEAGVPAQDRGIQKAASFIRSKLPHTDDTYELSLAVLFLDRLGDPADKKLIQTCALRLIAGQYWTGGWSYVCPRFKEGQDAALLKLLETLAKKNKGGKPTNLSPRVMTGPADALAWPRKAPWTVDDSFSYEKPRQNTGRSEFRRELDGFKGLAIFQNVKKLDWRERSNSKMTQSIPLIGITDNSNTQFALLALWVAQRHGVPAEASFRLLVVRFERSKLGSYGFPGVGWENSSMICVDLLGLAIGRGLNLSASTSSLKDRDDVSILTGLAALYSDIGTPTGQMDKPVPTKDVYFLWSVERVGMLFDLPTIGDKEWYRWGVEILVTNQLDTGEFKAEGVWENKNITVRDTREFYGPILKTAFALLFLKRSHPMSDLTPNLPFTAKGLNDGVARLRSSDSRLKGSSTSPSRNIQRQR